MAVQHALGETSRLLRSLRLSVCGPTRFIGPACLLFFVCITFVCRTFYLPVSVPADVRDLQPQTGPPWHNGPDLSKADAPFIGWPLTRICNETVWTPGVVFMCDNNSGGIGNIRNYMLTCIRYAIEVGATGLVLPRIEQRSADDVAMLFNGSQPMDYFFDVDHFRSNLNKSCPAMTIYDSVEVIPHLRLHEPEVIEPKAYGERESCDFRDLNRYTDLFDFRFHTWLRTSAEELKIHTVDAEHPRLFRFIWGVQYEFPVWKDGPEFANTYGGLLRFREDIIRLGNDITNLMRKQGLPPPEAERGCGKYAAVHLRTESDAMAHWPTYEMQVEGFRARLDMKRDEIQSIYLATGNATEAEKFIKEIDGIPILTKHMVLKNEPYLLQLLEDMSWDQQALVEYVVIANSDYFLGVNPSSFSMNIAAKRHLRDNGLYSRPWKVGHDDGRTYLVGKYQHFWEDWLYMYEGLWP